VVAIEGGIQRLLLDKLEGPRLHRLDGGGLLLVADDVCHFVGGADIAESRSGSTPLASITDKALAL